MSIRIFSTAKCKSNGYKIIFACVRKVNAKFQPEVLICKAFTTLLCVLLRQWASTKSQLFNFITICKPIKQVAKHHGVYGNFITDGERPGVLLRKGQCKFNNIVQHVNKEVQKYAVFRNLPHKILLKV